MTGLLTKKYYIAVLDGDASFVNRMISALKNLYNNRVVVEAYTDSYQMFKAMNMNKVKNCPFDLAVMSPRDEAEKMILKRTNPGLKVVLCSDETSLKTETSKILL